MSVGMSNVWAKAAAAAAWGQPGFAGAVVTSALDDAGGGAAAGARCGTAAVAATLAAAASGRDCGRASLGRFDAD